MVVITVEMEAGLRMLGCCVKPGSAGVHVHPWNKNRFAKKHILYVTSKPFPLLPLVTTLHNIDYIFPSHFKVVSIIHLSSFIEI